MNALAVGIISSLLAACILAVVGTLSSKRCRAAAIRLLGWASGLDVEGLYARQADASGDVAAELAKARWVFILAARGSELDRDAFAPLWRTRYEQPTRILLPNPSIDGTGSWVRHREVELSTHDPAYGGGVLAAQITATLELLRVRVLNGLCEVRLFDAPHLCRLVVTDRRAFVTLYTAREHGRSSRCLRLRSGGILYGYFHRVAEALWTQSAPFGQAPPQPPSPPRAHS